ncbi:MAG: FAD-dependent monooxygenase [Myxococcales bacterium]|nr:FAD-dependent monooxygenase [Myxococcales bacterium]
MDLDVAIIGCGSAGGAAALLLARQGHRVTVYEAVDDPKPVGAGIVLQPTGLGVLHRLGLYERVVGRGAIIDRLYCRTVSGRVVIDLSYAELAPSLFGLGIHRGALFDALFGAVRSEPGVTLRCGCPIDSFAAAGDSGRGVERRWLVDARGRRHGPHELVIVADGARSQLRDDLEHLVVRAARYPWGALWFVADDPGGLGFDRTLTQVVEGTRAFLGLLPTGLGARGEKPLLSLFWSLHGDRVTHFRRAGLRAFREQVLRYEPRAAPIIEQVPDIDALLFAPYYDVVMSRWHWGNCVFVGDAAHATSPQLGQGANLALYDAAVLADCVAELDSPRALPEALARYTRARRAHLGFYQRMTRWLTPFFQGESRALAAMRDYGMGLSRFFAPLRRAMVATMAGVRLGFVRPSMRLSDVRAALPPRTARRGPTD